MNSDPHVSLALQLRRARARAGLTQEELAERAGVSVRTLAAIESGSMHTPRQATLRLLAAALALSPEATHDFLTLGRPQSPSPSQQVPLTNLPAAPTPIIGRELLAQDAMQLLRHTHLRLLTLIGPAGVGKTRLALDIAHRLLGDFRDGVYLIALAPLSAAALVPSAIAAAVGVREQGQAALADRLVAALREQHMLLVLDNFEHLADATPFVADLLSACHSLTVLVTSRSPLHLRAEHLLDVPPLALPPVDPPLPLAELATNPAVTLFVQRLQSIRPDITLSAHTAPVITEICVRLDGIPLALELAAARCRLLSLNDVRARLDARFALLTNGMRDLPEHQRTLRATLDWSYALLDRADQRCFRHLAVFAGSATLDAIIAVCHLPAEEHITHLLDQSLVQRVTNSEPVRITQLETLRAYGWELLQAQQESDAARAEHAAVYLALAEQAQANVATAERSYYLAQLDLDRENLREALIWSQATDAVAEGLRLSVALQWYWVIRGRYAEGREWVVSFLERDQALGFIAPSSVRARALSAAGRIALNQSDFAAAMAYEEAGLAIFVQLQDPQRQAMSWNGLALIADKQSHFDEATTRYQRALTLFTEVSDAYNMGRVTINIGNVAFLRGALDDAAMWYQRGIEHLRATDDPQTLAMAQGNLAALHEGRGELDEAATIFQEILVIFQRLGDQDNIAETMMNLGYVRYQQGHLSEAESLTTVALRIQRQIQHQRGVAEVLKHLSLIMQAEERLDDAVVMSAESLMVFHRIGSGHGIVTALIALVGAMMEQGATTEAVQLLAAALTHAQSLAMQLSPRDQAKVTALREQAQAILGAESFAAVWATGAAWSPDDAVAAVQGYLDTDHPPAL